MHPILLVLTGELITELEDGRLFTLKQGISYEVQHEGESHRSRSLSVQLYLL